MAVVGEAGDGMSAVKLAKMLAPDVVVLALAIPGMNGVEIARRVTAEVPTGRILALSMHTENRLIEDMLSAGAMGYAHKGCSFAELTQAIRTVAAGRPYLCATTTRAINGAPVHDDPVAARGISAREREVLQLLAEGKTQSEIAVGLGITVRTVYTHCRRMKAKLAARNTADLIRYAILQGLAAVD